ncbi:MAG: NADPH:quinone oxidoreductase family protein [Caulobacter sp.]|nr:NADPH:quinone oxidoreductase family protein [Caulobacter sp.]
MKAIVVRAYGAFDALRVEDHDAPTVGPGQVRVRVHAAAANYVDALIVSGRYQVKPPLPFIPGAEFGGLVESVGEGVDRLSVGDRVCGSQVGGAFGELVTASATMVFRIPASMSFIDAAIFRASNGTAFHALVQRGALQRGETVLVLGGGGAVGYSAIQIAKALGARVIASASSTEKRVLAMTAGADLALDTSAPDWSDQVKAATAGRGVDVVVDPVGGDMSETAFRRLAWRGRHLVIGFAAGGIPAIKANLALLKGAAMVGVDFRQFNLFEPETAAENMSRLLALYEAGALPVPPVKIYAPQDAGAALADALSGAVLGRRVVDFSTW